MDIVNTLLVGKSIIIIKMIAMSVVLIAVCILPYFKI